MANMFSRFREEADKMQNPDEKEVQSGGFLNRTAFGDGKVTWGLVILMAFAVYALVMFARSVLYFFL